MMIPTGIRRIPATDVTPGQAVDDEEITKVLRVSRSLMALKLVSNGAEADTGSDQEEMERTTTPIPRADSRRPKIRRIKIEESDRAAVTAKPAKPNALKPGAASWPEMASPSEFSVGKVTLRKNHVCDHPMRIIAERTKVALIE